ncbi:MULTISPECIES: hypothetical protein [unclassified Neorhizobium]|uniref:hypothetical protein n=1 Tax=unclassified Neorhizobium TaxID=2629175 RepID=UPI001FF2BF38|nr:MULTISPECIES: hypothetical protein [unclassified Neorhizobium]MCJ9672160.1 hypothetical protein [Neorhizobium sp. SHOUNA12B]MCJ9748037.1 hypothetical protein [Neorhizobium sp. SHOUNA12A]
MPVSAKKAPAAKAAPAAKPAPRKPDADDGDDSDVEDRDASDVEDREASDDEGDDDEKIGTLEEKVNDIVEKAAAKRAESTVRVNPTFHIRLTKTQRKLPEEKRAKALEEKEAVAVRLGGRRLNGEGNYWKIPARCSQETLTKLQPFLGWPVPDDAPAKHKKNQLKREQREVVLEVLNSRGWRKVSGKKKTNRTQNQPNPTARRDKGGNNKRR